MEIAAAGYVLPLPGPLQDRPQPRNDNSGRPRAESARDAGRVDTSADSARSGGRVIDGEVIYSRPESAPGVDAAQRGLAGSTSGFSFQENRRFSLQAAVQAFRDNEALLTRPGEQRQVSGIIDEYV
jgi:hypothetical protein